MDTFVTIEATGNRAKVRVTGDLDANESMRVEFWLHWAGDTPLDYSRAMLPVRRILSAFNLGMESIKEVQFTISDGRV